MPAGVVDMTGRGTAGHAGVVGRRQNGVDLNRKTVRGIVTAEALGIGPLHVTVNAFLLKTLLELRVFSYNFV